jgi:DNA-binding FrmR family transcriptional regulator
MKSDELECGDVLDRLRRVHGQLGGLIQMIETGRDCTEVLTLLAAITHGLHRAGYRMVAAGLERCLDDPDGPDTVATAKLEKLFLALG